ncbi:MAG: phosphoribosylglycinamide formyltransferase [Oscillospiraceae bacterium]|nr:phosphoribosylglycinamide formyltransferase [Oscillospiraceae bacterium]
MSKLRLTVLVSGGGTNLQAIIDAIASGDITNAEIVGVISNNPGVYALERAANAGIPAFVISPRSYDTRADFNVALKDKIDELGTDLVVLAGCLVTIPEILIDAYENKIINIHPALIPAFCGKGYYGLKVHEAALRRGVKLSGATVHFVNKDLDAGPIILQKAVEVKEGDTPKDLQLRIMEQAEWKIMPKAIDLIANGKVTVKDGHVIIS